MKKNDLVIGSIVFAVLGTTIFCAWLDSPSRHAAARSDINALHIVMIVSGCIFFAVIAIWLLRYPKKLALKRGVKQVDLINVLAMLGFFMPLLWIVALLWAAYGTTETPKK